MTQIAEMKSAPSSRIPMPVPRKRTIEYDIKKTVSAPTKLELMQKQYQEKLQRDKEKRMHEINFQNEERTMRFGENRSVVKDFFKERREIAHNNGDMPNIERHFSQKKAELRGDSLSYTNHYQTKKQYGYGAKPLHKNSAGRDKSTPLAPIEKPPRAPELNGGKKSRKSSAASNGSFYSQNQSSFQRKPAPLGRPPLSRKTSFGSGANTPNGNEDHHGRRSKQLGEMSEDEDKAAIFSSRNASPKNKRTSFKDWQERQKKLRDKNHQTNANEQSALHDQEGFNENSNKMTDFQKWQMEQDKDRSQRLEKNAQVNGYHQSSPHTNRSGVPSKAVSPFRAPDGGMKSPGRAKRELLQKRINTQSKKHLYASQASSAAVSGSESDDEADAPYESQDVIQKQKELEALLRKQQEELEKMKRQREKEEDQERKAREREAKRAEQQRERQRKLKEAEEKKRREEEEKERKEREKREKDEQDLQWYQEQKRNKINSTQPPKQYSRQGDYDDTREYDVPISRAESQPSNTQNFIPNKPTRVKKNRNINRRQPTPDPEPYEAHEDPIAFYASTAVEDPEAHGVVDLAPCSLCGRKFARDRLSKHAKVCQAGKKKARKVFNTQEMRVQGTEQAQFVKETHRRPEPPPKKNNWRAQHDNFIKTIRYAKQVTEAEQAGGDLSHLPPPPKTENPDYVPCPYCQRTFNQTAAERHIPRCKEVKSRPPPMKLNSKRR